MKIWIAKFDETKYWTDESLKRVAGKIFAVYAYNPALVVHCCEITPSRELHLFGYVISGTPEFSDFDDEQRDAVFEQLRAGLRDDQDVIYVHAADVDKLPELETATATEHGRALLGDFDVDEPPDVHPDGWTDEQMADAIDAAREYAYGNGYVDT